jgi:hypothetical protein
MNYSMISTGKLFQKRLFQIIFGHKNSKTPEIFFKKGSMVWAISGQFTYTIYRVTILIYYFK